MSKIQDAIIKRDTLANWQKAKNYIPKENVIIVMDDEENDRIMLMIGDGKTLVNKLPNLLDLIGQSAPDSKSTVTEDGVLEL